MVNGSQQINTILEELKNELKDRDFPRQLGCVFVFITVNQLSVRNGIIPTPVHCNISHFSVVADGVIGGDGCSPISALLAASCLTTPRINGLEFQTVPANLYELKNSNIKAIIYFTRIEFLETNDLFLFDLLQMPVVGSIVKKNLSRDCGRNEPTQIIAVCGPRVKATSVIIGAGMHDAMKIERKLRELDEVNGERVDFRFAFMFTNTCSTKSDMEYALFRKVFPKVPLIGLLHTKQIGMDCLKKTCTKVGVYGDSTSVFLLVTVTTA